VPDEQRRLADFGLREMSAMAVMILVLVWLGVYPQPVLEMAQPVVDSLLAGVKP
jgi:NADH-quinone oxidoreductase subunit M